VGYFFFFLGGAEAAESARCFLDASIASSCACRIVCVMSHMVMRHAESSYT